MATDNDISTIGQYTPAMLAELIGLSVSQVRRWHRRGLLQATHEVRRLPYFDFHGVAAARRIAEWLKAGISAKVLGRQLDALRRAWPGVAQPLAELPIVLDGKRLLVRQAEGLAAADGQLWFDFDEQENEPVQAIDLQAARNVWARPTGDGGRPATSEELLLAAIDLEDDGQLSAAADLYRSALAAGGPTPEICFLLAELLYRLGDLSGSRERYFMAIELDENYVEARANLGCVLAELGERELAVAAFAGALAYHADYADAHFHLARTLDELGRRAEAESHWRTFLTLAPESPWADEAQQRLRLV